MRDVIAGGMAGIPPRPPCIRGAPPIAKTKSEKKRKGTKKVRELSVDEGRNGGHKVAEERSMI